MRPLDGLRAAVWVLLLLCVRAGWFSSGRERQSREAGAGKSLWSLLDEYVDTVTGCAPVLAKLMAPSAIASDLKGVGDLQRAGGVLSAIAGFNLEHRTNSEQVGLLGALAKCSLLCYDAAMRGREYLVTFQVPLYLSQEHQRAEQDESAAAQNVASTRLLFRQRYSTHGDGGNTFDVWTCTEKRLLVVAFRGSHTPHDWISNLDLRVTSNGWHGGFEESMRSMEANLRSIAEEFPGPDWRVVFTGHSRGGALALLAAELFHSWSRRALRSRDGPSADAEGPHDGEEALQGEEEVAADRNANGVHGNAGGSTTGKGSDAFDAAKEAAGRPKRPPLLIGAATFGQPRVGGEDFCKRIANLLGRRYLRVVHSGDVIPRLPAGQSFAHTNLPYLEVKHPSGSMRWRDNAPEAKDMRSLAQEVLEETKRQEAESSGHTSPTSSIISTGRRLFQSVVSPRKQTTTSSATVDDSASREANPITGPDREEDSLDEDAQMESSITQHIHVNYARNLERGIRRICEDRAVDKADPEEEFALASIRSFERIVLNSAARSRLSLSDEGATVDVDVFDD